MGTYGLNIWVAPRLEIIFNHHYPSIHPSNKYLVVPGPVLGPGDVAGEQDRPNCTLMELSVWQGYGCQTKNYTCMANATRHCNTRLRMPLSSGLLCDLSESFLLSGPVRGGPDRFCV